MAGAEWSARPSRKVAGGKDVNLSWNSEHFPEFLQKILAEFFAASLGPSPSGLRNGTTPVSPLKKRLFAAPKPGAGRELGDKISRLLTEMLESPHRATNQISTLSGITNFGSRSKIMARSTKGFEPYPQIVVCLASVRQTSDAICRVAFSWTAFLPCPPCR